ncbi:hypothetical protein [Streptomyces sp. Ncost-T10-10d]|uniref:hypothetical protein n=1 Tax=Streptomyces sp. Ncost-T10-10d TaxID=1839774 RepID=UPI00081ECD8F|nr:hypothetical protein [Streptomyces sp. Ncost-T10-10d]SCF82903.1 hypothetical protein GA0115254_11856 [Streptomyces sp. Ncost-T10-10d]
MRIELTWPRPGTEDRTLTLPLPGLPTDLLGPTLRHASRLRTPAALRRAIACAEPVLGAAARASGADALTRAALPYAIRFTRQALLSGTPAAIPSQAARAIPSGSHPSTPRPPAP